MFQEKGKTNIAQLMAGSNIALDSLLSPADYFFKEFEVKKIGSINRELHGCEV